MKGKRWLSVFFLLLFAGMAGYMAINYHVDPVGYFTVKKDNTYYDWNNYTRAIKTDYVTKNSDQIEGIILGGSKAGTISTELLSKYTGKNYYNFCFNWGNFSDYLIYTKYFIENTNVSEITLHLSSFEVDYYSYNASTTLKVPAVVSGNLWDQITENCGFLLSDLDTLEKGMKKQKDTSKLDNVTTGQRNLSAYYAKYDKNPESYVNRRVLKTLDRSLDKLFAQVANSEPAYDDNLNALREIKQLCEENGVTLKVVIGASFIGERYLYECDRYYDYLHELVTITDVWDFSDFSDINRNPYNFVDRRHFNNTIADLMVDTMYGKDSRDDFGVYLTKDNINEYLIGRKAKFEQLKKEFEETGTVALLGMDDDSYYPVKG